MSVLATIIERAAQIASAGSSAFLAMSLGTAPDAANRVGLFADLTGAAEQLVVVVGAQTGPAFLRSGSDVIATGMKLQDSTCQIVGSSDTSKSLAFQVDTQGSGFQLTIDVGAQAANRTLSVPVLGGNRTIALIDQTQTFSGIQTFSSAVVIESGNVSIPLLPGGTYIGYEAGAAGPGDGTYNTLVGYQCGKLLGGANTGYNNSMFGFQSGPAITTGFANTGVGIQTLQALTSGSYNFAGNIHALLSLTDGIGNNAVGAGALQNDNPSYCNALGMYAGRDCAGSGSLFLGHRAGMTETEGNKLYIANNETTTLIGGDFSTGVVTIQTLMNAGKAMSGTWPINTSYAFWQNNAVSVALENAALLQFTDGSTIVNGATGTTNSLRVGIASVLEWSATGVSVTGAIAASGNITAGVAQIINNIAGSSRDFAWQTSGVDRFRLRCSGEAESGSDAGSNIYLNAYTDAGVYIDSPFIITRAAGGLFSISRSVSIASTTASTNTSTGSLINAGGFGCGGAGNFGGIVSGHGGVYVGQVANLPSTGLFRCGGSDSDLFGAFRFQNAENGVQWYANMAGSVSGSVPAWQDNVVLEGFIPSGTSHIMYSAYSGEHQFLTGSSRVKRASVSDTALTLASGVSLITPVATPASAGAAGIQGQWAADADYIYRCTATNTWKRVAIATW